MKLLFSDVENSVMDKVTYDNFSFKVKGNKRNLRRGHPSLSGGHEIVVEITNDSKMPDAIARLYLENNQYWINMLECALGVMLVSQSSIERVSEYGYVIAFYTRSITEYERIATKRPNNNDSDGFAVEDEPRTHGIIHNTNVFDGCPIAIERTNVRLESGAKYLTFVTVNIYLDNNSSVIKCDVTDFFDFVHKKVIGEMIQVGSAIERFEDVRDKYCNDINMYKGVTHIVPIMLAKDMMTFMILIDNSNILTFGNIDFSGDDIERSNTITMYDRLNRDIESEDFKKEAEIELNKFLNIMHFNPNDNGLGYFILDEIEFEDCSKEGTSCLDVIDKHNKRKLTYYGQYFVRLPESVKAERFKDYEKAQILVDLISSAVLNETDEVINILQPRDTISHDTSGVHGNIFDWYTIPTSSKKDNVIINRNGYFIELDGTADEIDKITEEEYGDVIDHGYEVSYEKDPDDVNEEVTIMKREFDYYLPKNHEHKKRVVFVCDVPRTDEPDDGSEEEEVEPKIEERPKESKISKLMNIFSRKQKKEVEVNENEDNEGQRN